MVLDMELGERPTSIQHELANRNCSVPMKPIIPCFYACIELVHIYTIMRFYRIKVLIKCFLYLNPSVLGV